MTTVTVSEATRDFAGTLRLMTSGKSPIVLKRGRRTVAVMMPPSVVELLEDLEDIREADHRMREIKSGQDHLVPYQQVRKELGLG